MAKKGKKKKNQDFQKVKLKVGRKLKPAANETETKFKAKSVLVQRQFKETRHGQSASKKDDTVSVSKLTFTASGSVTCSWI